MFWSDEVAGKVNYQSGLQLPNIKLIINFDIICIKQLFIIDELFIKKTITQSVYFYILVFVQNHLRLQFENYY